MPPKSRDKATTPPSPNIQAQPHSATSPNQAAKYSCPKGRRTKNEVIQGKLLPGWYLRSVLLQGGLELTFLTTQTLKDDAFGNPLVQAIKDGIAGEGNGRPITTIGLSGAYFMRNSLKNPGKKLNMTSLFQRKAFLRVLDASDMNSEKRLQALHVIKAFLEEAKNNNFNTPVFIQPKAWDLTPSDGELPKLDHYLQYTEILKIIRDLYDDMDNDWAKDNPDDAMCYFTPGYIPLEAHTDLGFPLHEVMTSNQVGV